MLAYASVFGNVDSYGDIVAKGAFTNTLKDWAERGKSKGQSIPFLYGHNMSDPNMNIGSVLEATEDEKGLRIKVQFDDDPMAQKVYRLVKAGRLNELSFAFDVVKSAWIDDEENPKAMRELQELKLYECSAVPIGANSETEVLAIKSGVGAALGLVDGIKAGRSLSKKNEESLRSALDQIIAAKDALESVLPAKAPEDDPDADEDTDTPDSEDDPDADEDVSEGVTSDVTLGKASGSDSSLGDEDVESIATKVAELLGLTPPSKTDQSPSAPTVTDTELELELLTISE